MEGANSGKNTFKCDFLHFACHQILSILTIAANISSCPRTTLPPSPTAFSISQYFCVLRSPACTVQDELIVLNEEEYHCYMVQCLDCGDLLTVRETGKEMSNKLAKMEFEEILEFNHKIRKKVKVSKRIIVLIFTTNSKHKKPSAAASITLAWTEYKSTT